MNKGKPIIVFSLSLHRRLAIIDISGVLSFFELVSYLKTGYLACKGAVVPWLMHSTPDRVVRLSSIPGQGHCIVFLGETLCSHNASLHPGPGCSKPD